MTGRAAELDDPRSQSSPFRGLEIAAAAGLRLKPGCPRPVFDNDVWDLSGLADAPVVMGTHRKVLDFTVIANPIWRAVARQYIFARIAPHLPAVATLPQAFRTPLNPHSLWNELKHLSAWFNFLTGAGIVSLRQVTQADCDAYLRQASRSETDPGRQLSPATTVATVRVTQFIALYAELLADSYAPEFIPWNGRSADTIVGHVRTSENRVPNVPDALLRPLLSDCLYLLGTIGPLMISEAGAARAYDLRESQSRRGLKVAEVSELREAIRNWRAQGRPAPQAAASTVAHRLKSGWNGTDPLLQVAFHPLVVEACGAMGHRRDRETLRPELEQWARERGVQPPWGREAQLVPRHGDGAPLRWTDPISRAQLDTAAHVITSAAYFLTSALTGMRASELAELTTGCRRQEARPGSGSRFRVAARRIKGAPFGGADDEWVVIQDVHSAIGIAEQITGAAEGELLFARGSNNSASRGKGLRSWINGPMGQRLGLDPIPEGPINPRALRRTLAMTIAQRPHGLMAARIHLKHISVATTEGYTARPGGHQASFIAEISNEEEAEHLRLTMAAYDDYKRGILPAGQGARDLIAAFKSVDRMLDQHDAGTVTVIDDRRVERILKAKSATLHVGPGNYCWFSDPSKALCLRLAQTPDAAEPLLGMCDSARCSQATHHPVHRQVWAEHAQATRTVFLGTPRVSALEQGRALKAAERAERIVASIDNAAGIEQN